MGFQVTTFGKRFLTAEHMLKPRFQTPLGEGRYFPCHLKVAAAVTAADSGSKPSL